MPKKADNSHGKAYENMTLEEILAMPSWEASRLNKVEMTMVLTKFIKYARERVVDMRQRHWDDSTAGETAKQYDYFKGWKPDDTLNDMRTQFRKISTFFKNPLSDRENYKAWKNQAREAFLTRISRYVKLSNNREYFWYDKPIYKKDAEGNDTSVIDHYKRARQRINKKFISNFFDFYNRTKELTGARALFENADRGTNTFFNDILYYFANMSGNVTFTNVEKYIRAKLMNKNISHRRLLEILLSGEY